jgi:hypothetical protein
MFMQEFSYTIVHVNGEDNGVADNLSRLCHDYLHDDESEQALAHEAEAIELIAAFLATQKMVEYVAPTVEWAATEVNMNVDVAQEQLQRIPAGPQNLTAETFELIQRARNYVVGHHGVQRTLEKLRRQGVRFEGMRALVKQFIEFCPCCQKISRIAPAIQETPFTMATYRFGERIDNDTIGPLPKDDYGNEHVVVISRFVKLTPVSPRRGQSANRFRWHIRVSADHPVGSRNTVPKRHDYEPCYGGLRGISTRHDGRLEGGKCECRTRK